MFRRVGKSSPLTLISIGAFPPLIILLISVISRIAPGMEVAIIVNCINLDTNYKDFRLYLLVYSLKSRVFCLASFSVATYARYYNW